MKPLVALVVGALVLSVVVLALALRRWTSMPGEARPDASRATTTRAEPETAGAEPPSGPNREERLRAAVFHLAGTIGERNVFTSGSLDRAATWIEAELTRPGLVVRSIEQQVRRSTVRCIEATLAGTDPAAGCVIVGAHYDSIEGTPGANDNASGTAALLELARAFAERGAPRRTIRFVAFPNEEPPFFQDDEMGSLLYAERLRTLGVDVSAMMSLESIGYYDDAEGSQQYPAGIALLYPSTGDFIGFVSNVEHGDLVRRAIARFRETATVPSEGASLPGAMPGIGWSDHWAFWQTGVPAFMVTDTAVFRDPTYHTAHDTPERLDYARMAAVVTGLEPVIADLADD